MRRLNRGVIALAVVLVLHSAVGGSRALHVTAAPAGDWTTYLGDLGRSGDNSNETVVNANSAAALQPLWSTSANATVSTQPIVSNGIIYWGDWNCYEHATSLTGTAVWSDFLGGAATCGGRGHITSTGTIGTITINGQAQTLLFAAANSYMYALDPASGSVLWQSPALGLGPIWSSPALYNGNLYVGLMRGPQGTYQSGQIVELNAATGVVLHTFYDGPNGCAQAGTIWGSPTIDQATGILYVATGDLNGCTTNTTSYWADSVLALNTSDLSQVGAWHIPAYQDIPDGDFGSTPTLFSATIGGVQRSLLGVANKNGMYYVFDRTNVSAGPVWQIKIGMTAGSPENGQGSVSPSGWDGSNLYIAGGYTTLNNVMCWGSLRKINPATGSAVWSDCFPDGPVVGAVTLVPGLVIVGEGNTIQVIDSNTGVTLYTYRNASGQYFYSASTISNGVLYAADASGMLYAFNVGGLGPNLSAMPGSAAYPSKPAVEAHNFPAGQTVNLYWDDVGTTSIATATASGTGSALMHFSVPDVPSGPHDLYAVNQGSGVTASIPYEVGAQAPLGRVAESPGRMDTISGHGFGPGEIVNIYFKVAGGTLLGTAATSTSGDFSTVSFRTPTVSYAAYKIIAVGQSSGQTVVDRLIVSPSASITSSSGASASQQTLTGRGFASNESIAVYWNCGSLPCPSSSLVSTVTASPNGTFSSVLTIPTAGAGSTYPLLLQGRSSTMSATTSFTVTS